MTTIPLTKRGAELLRLQQGGCHPQDGCKGPTEFKGAKYQYLAQSGLIGDGLPNHRTLFKHVAGSSELAEGSNELKVRLESELADGSKVAKVLTFKRNSYLVDVAWEIDNASGKASNAHAYYQLQRDDQAPAAADAVRHRLNALRESLSNERVTMAHFERALDDKRRSAANSISINVMPTL